MLMMAAPARESPFRTVCTLSRRGTSIVRTNRSGHRHMVARLSEHEPMAVHLGFATHPGQAIDETPELKQITEPERAPSRRDHHEHVRLDDISPRRRQRQLNAIDIEEEHPVLRPSPTDPEQNELSPTPRMKRMRHPH